MAEITSIPARYVGSNTIMLAEGQGTGRNIDGTRRESRAISRFDILLLPETEVRGYTLLFDPQGKNPPEDLGVGRRIKPEHLDFKDDARELSALGYEFHEGRADFELLTDEEVAQEVERLHQEQGG